MKQWKRLAALSSAIVMAAATLTYFPSDTLQNIPWKITANAETTTEPQVWIEDNLTWTLDADGTLNISGTGAMKDYDYYDNPSPVYNNSNVKKVVIEDGVTSIGNAAFRNCSSLTSITIPNSVTSIGNDAFYVCSGLTSITIPDSVTSIGNSAFYRCSNLTTITIPNSVTGIGNFAFYVCSGLTSITIPNSVTSIGNFAFYDCSSLTSITIPDSVTSIGYAAFYNCTNLTSITIPNSVTHIEISAFDNCTNLKTISLSCKSTLKKSDFGKQANLVSYTNQHILTKAEAKAATCTENGNKEYWTCEYCGKYFLSDDSNPATATAVEQSETILPALNHKNVITRNAVKPTETAPGYSGDRYCPDCDMVEKGYTYWKEDKLTWTLYADGTLNISGKGAMKDYNYSDNPSPASQKKDSVKKVVIEDGVTSIENYAFRSCSSLTSITIPDSVTSIGKLAFYSCDSLTSITISNSVTSIEERAFAYCSRLTSITIPDSVTSIGEAAFAGCSSLTSITIPDSVTSIGEYAFQSCSSLTSITIPDSVTSIGWYAFSNCESLTSITIPDSVTSIGSRAFSECYILKTISLSCGSALKKSDFGDQANLVSYALHTLKKTEAKTVTCAEDGNKEYWTCEHCGKYFLSDDTNPETAKAVEQSEFIIPALNHKNAITRGASEPTETAPGYSGDRYCPDCDTVFEKGYTYWNEGDLTWKLYEDGTLNISGTGAMKDYNDDDNPSPAYKNSNVKKIVIEKGVTSIGESAFENCSSLTSVMIPDSVISIGTSAFHSCNRLTSITLPDSVTSIGIYVFEGCNSLSSITLSNNITSIGNWAFHGCPLTSITIPDSVTSIGAMAFHSCSNLKSITIPDSVTSIESAVFYNCTSLTSITIPDSVTSIGSYAFSDCSSLTSITIPDSVTSIGYEAFDSCSNLKTISLSCKSSLKKSKFGEQADLVSYTLHTLKKTEAKTATCAEDGNIEYWTCEHCGKYFLSDDANPETAKAVEQSETILPALNHKNAITRGASEPTETAPGYSGDRYCPDCDTVLEKGYTYWVEGNLTWKLYEDGTLNISGTGAMKDYNDDDNPSPAYKNSNVKKVVIEDGVTNIGERAFYDCSSLTSITIPDSVTSIGYAAFYGCNSLTSITIPDSVTSIGNWTFYNCSSLTSITIPDSVTRIGEAAFNSCGSLTSITIPDSVTSIGYAAFNNCGSLTSITIPDSVTRIGELAFSCCGLTSITIPSSVTSIGRYAFYKCTGLTSITIPDSVTSIGDSAFSDCNSLKTISLSCGSALKKSDFGGQANLVSYTNQHLLTKTAAKTVTCAEDGNKEYWTCEHCGKYFLSDDANPETAKAVELSETVIPASHKLTKVEAKAATCTEDGNIEHWTCEHCGKYFLSDDTNPETAKAVEQAETIISASHKLTKVEAKAATCTEDGNKAYWTCEHCKKYFLSDDTNPETAKAVELSETVIPASHKLTKVEAKAATCTEDGNKEHWTCEHCKKYFLSDDTNPETAKAVELSEITIPAIKHSYDKNGFCKNDDTHYQPASYNEESEKYEISNAGQLYWFAEQVNSGETSLNAVLTTDIVVNETVLAADGSLGADPDTLRMWYPIGVGDDYAENIFKGTFDGQGHTISGLYFSNDSNARDVICASLFGFSAGIIQNVGLEDSYLNHHNASVGICAMNDGQIVNCYNAGTILGFGASGICIENSDNGSIENCYNTGVIRGSWLAAGICNMNAGSMKDCYNNSDITVMTDSTIIDENDEKSYASGICNNNSSSGRIENCYHVGQVSGADVNNNICNHNAGQIENSYYDCNICDKDAITQNESSAVMKNVEGKTTKQFASGEVTYLLNGDQSVRAFYQNLAKEKYPTLNQKSKVVMQLERIYDESFGEDATTNKTYHNAGDTIALETSPDKAYTYQYFVNGKQIEKSNYTLTGNTKMTVKRVPVEIELSEIDTIQLTCQKKMTLDLTEYLKNFADLKPVQFQLDADSKLPDGLKLTEDGILSGTPKKAATVKTTIVLTAENGATKEMHLVFIVNAPVTTTTTTTTTKATTTTKPSKTTTTKATTTTKPSKTTTTNATTTTKPSKTTTTNATTTTKPSKTTTTKVTTTTKPNKTTTTKVTTTTKPSKTTTTKATTTTKPSKTTTTNATTTTKPSKTTTTNATTATKPSKTTTTNATTTTKPSKTTTTNATTTTKPNKTTTTKATTTTIITTTNTAIPSYGDVNLDGKVDILDAVFLNKYLATLIQFSDAQMANADCCQDGILDDQDTTALMQFIILLIDDLPVQPTEK